MSGRSRRSASSAEAARGVMGRLAAGGRADRLVDLLGLGVLQQVADRAGVERPQDASRSENDVNTTTRVSGDSVATRRVTSMPSTVGIADPAAAHPVVRRGTVTRRPRPRRPTPRSRRRRTSPAVARAPPARPGDRRRAPRGSSGRHLHAHHRTQVALSRGRTERSPPASRTMSARICRPMWPPARACAAICGAIPRPSSRDLKHRPALAGARTTTFTAPASACSCTLRRVSCAAR